MDFAAFITEFQRRLDAAETMADMLMPDARLVSSHDTLEGAEAIDAYVTARTADQVVRHMWSNLQVEVEGADRATLRYLATAWHGTLATTLHMMTLGDVTDKLERGADGAWRLSSSHFNRIFKHIY